MKDFNHEIYNLEPKMEEPSGWIQWKGTDVCMDVYCKCGYHGHVDTDFFYYYECPKCKSRYRVGCNVKLYELTEEQGNYIGADGFKTCELQEEE